MDTNFLILLVSFVTVLAAGVLLSPLSRRLGIPVLLLFMALGIILRTQSSPLVEEVSLMTIFHTANLSLGLILFDGGLRTPLNSFRVGLKPAVVLSTVGVLFTAVLVGIIASFLLQIPLLVGLLLGAIVSSTDAAAVFSLLQGKGLRLNERITSTLEIESGSNDPMAIFLTILLITHIELGGAYWSDTLIADLQLLVSQFGLGLLGGYIGGVVTAKILSEINLAPGMYPLLAALGGLLVFILVSLYGGSGFLAIYLMGVTVAARNPNRLSDIQQFNDTLAWLAQLVLFVLLGLMVDLQTLISKLGSALLIAAVLMFVARPLATSVSLLPFGFSKREHLFMAWVGLRGAVPVVLAVYPLIAGMNEGVLLFQVAFVVVLVSLLLQGSTLAWLARWLNLEVPPRPEPELRVPLRIIQGGNNELMLYPLHGKRWEQSLDITELHLPLPARILGCLRNGQVLDRRHGLQVGLDDAVIVIAPASMALDIGSILGWDEPPEHLSDRRFFGDFTLKGSVSLQDVKLIYGIEVPGYLPSTTLSGCFADCCHGHPVIGDRIDLGSLLLVVRATEGDQVTKVGIRLENTAKLR